MAKGMDWKRANIRASNYRASLGDRKELHRTDASKRELVELARNVILPVSLITQGKRTMAPQKIDRHGKLIG